jgi:L-asparaginase
MSIQVIVTGGTFDKEYKELDGSLYFKNTHISDLLHLGRCDLKVAVQTLMLIDSLEMNDGHRSSILNACRSCPHEKIIITHGTDTMAETAEVLGRASLDKVIVLTGAMIPIKFGSSDGLFNLGAALGFVQCLPKGVYIAMNGRYFHWNNVQKNKAIGRFEIKQI